MAVPTPHHAIHSQVLTVNAIAQPKKATPIDNSVSGLCATLKCQTSPPLNKRRAWLAHPKSFRKNMNCDLSWNHPQ